MLRLYGQTTSNSLFSSQKYSSKLLSCPTCFYLHMHTLRADMFVPRRTPSRGRRLSTTCCTTTNQTADPRFSIRLRFEHQPQATIYRQFKYLSTMDHIRMCTLTGISKERMTCLVSRSCYACATDADT